MDAKRRLTSRTGRAALGAVVLLVAGIGLSDAVLHPGHVVGTVGVGATPIFQGHVYLQQNYPGIFYGQSFFTGSSFELTVEGNQTYDTAYAYAQVPYGTFQLNSYAPVFVPVWDGTGATVVTVDLSRPGGIVAVAPVVTGGTLSTTSIVATAADALRKETYETRVSGPGPDAVPVPMVAGTVHVTGTAVVLVGSGESACSATVALPPADVALAAGETVPLEIPLSVGEGDCLTGLAGTLDLAPIAGIEPARWWISTGGPTWFGQLLEANGLEYLFAGLPPGTYSPYAYAYFDAPAAGYLFVPNEDPSSVAVVAGQVTRRDFVFGTAAVSGRIVVSGPAASLATQAQAAFLGVNDYSLPADGPSAGGAGQAYAYAPDFTFVQVLTPGAWDAAYINVGFADPADPNWSASAMAYDAGSTRLAVASGDVVSLPDRPLVAAEGRIVFDVIEPLGSPTIGISNPSVSASGRDPASGQYLSLSGFRGVYEAPTPSVRMIGPPGVYGFEAWATVQNSYTKFASGTLELGANVNTPVGAPVVVQLTDASGAPLPVTATFCEVTAPGQTTASLSSVGPAAPPDFDLLPIAKGSAYLDVATSATYPCQVEIAVSYDPVALGLTPEREASLVLHQWVCTDPASCSWQPIPESGTPGDPRYFGHPGLANPDTVNHVVYGVTSQLGLFALGVANVVLVPPSDTCFGSPDARAVISTFHGVCARRVNNTNQLAGGCSGGGGGLASCTFDEPGDGRPPATVLELGRGPHDVAVTGTAVDGSTSSCMSFVEVVDREPPAVTCPEFVAPFECTGPTTPVTLQASCTDNCDPCSAICGEGPFPVGTTPVSCNAVDTSGNRGGCTTSVTVIDTVPPALTIEVTPKVLWSPDHKLVPIRIDAKPTDLCDPAPAVTCRVTSSEPALMIGSGQTPRDIVWSGGQLFLRAERSGTGEGRVYTITCTATDASGNRTEASATVMVPHDQAP